MVTSTRQQIELDADLERLNRLSLTRGVTPHVDLDWEQSTTDEEFASLYDNWSLLRGSGKDEQLDQAARATFVKYQQINLMLFTGLLERHGISALSRLYDLDSDQAFAEYVGHFIKEETYHYTMFLRGVEKIEQTMPDRPPLPSRQIDFALRWLFRLLHLIPGRRLRCSLTFLMFRFAEQVTIFAHQMVRETIPRRESLIGQVWSFHALEEARHLAFDALVIERNRLWWPVAWLPRMLALPCCVGMSALLNANEVWAARQVGVRVGYWQLPWLVARTCAPFKRRVFSLLGSMWRGSGKHDHICDESGDSIPESGVAESEA